VEPGSITAPVGGDATAAADGNMFGTILWWLRVVAEPMAHATLEITLPERVWIQQLSTAYPEATFEVLAAVPGDGTGFALVRIVGGDLAAITEEMNDHPQLTELTPISWTDEEATVHFETTAPLLLVSSRRSGISIELPIEIRDGTGAVEVTGPRERLSEFCDQLEAMGLRYRVEYVGDRRRDERLLSDRQREFVLAAIDRGYYDTPRRCSLTELAGELGVAKSTCSEILHRAEGAIVNSFAADRLGTDDTSDAERWSSAEP